MKKYYFGTLIIIILLGSCQSKKTFSIATGAKESTHYRVGEELGEIIEKYNKEYALEFFTEGEGTKSNLQHLIEGKAQFALVQNDIDSKSDLSKVRTVLPLYPQILFIIYDKNIEANSLEELVRGRKIAVGPRTGGTAIFTQQLFQNYGISPKSYEFVYSSYNQNIISDSIPISVSLTSPNNLRIAKMILQQGAKIWSLDDPNFLGKGTSVEGFCLINPLAQPFIIPKNIFNQYPSEPVLTVAVYNLLVTTTDTKPEAVYSLIETILEHKELLATRDIRFRFLEENFENSATFKFPLHQGARQYLRRNEPSFLERYAELIGVTVTMLTIFIGALSSLISINRRKRKNRIDHYYLEVIQIENDLQDVYDQTTLLKYAEQLKQLRQKAFQAVVSEKLGADDSFRIFIAFLNDVMRELQSRLSR